MMKKLKSRLLGIKPQSPFLTVKEIREIMKKGEDMPTAIFLLKRMIILLNQEQYLQ